MTRALMMMRWMLAAIVVCLGPAQVHAQPSVPEASSSDAERSQAAERNPQRVDMAKVFAEISDLPATQTLNRAEAMLVGTTPAVRAAGGRAYAVYIYKDALQAGEMEEVLIRAFSHLDEVRSGPRVNGTPDFYRWLLSEYAVDYLLVRYRDSLDEIEASETLRNKLSEESYLLLQERIKYHRDSGYLARKAAEPEVDFSLFAPLPLGVVPPMLPPEGGRAPIYRRREEARKQREGESTLPATIARMQKIQMLSPEERADVSAEEVLALMRELGTRTTDLDMAIYAQLSLRSDFPPEMKPYDRFKKAFLLWSEKDIQSQDFFLKPRTGDPEDILAFGLHATAYKALGSDENSLPSWYQQLMSELDRPLTLIEKRFLFVCAITALPAMAEDLSYQDVRDLLDYDGPPYSRRIQ